MNPACRRSSGKQSGAKRRVGSDLAFCTVDVVRILYCGVPDERGDSGRRKIDKVVLPCGALAELSSDERQLPLEGSPLCHGNAVDPANMHPRRIGWRYERPHEHCTREHHDAHGRKRAHSKTIGATAAQLTAHWSEGSMRECTMAKQVFDE